jgi:hypothetical protein
MAEFREDMEQERRTHGIVKKPVPSMLGLLMSVQGHDQHRE